MHIQTGNVQDLIEEQDIGEVGSRVIAGNSRAVTTGALFCQVIVQKVQLKLEHVHQAQLDWTPSIPSMEPTQWNCPSI